MENKSHALAAGVFVVVVTCMLVALAMWLTRDNAHYHEYELSSRDAVSGLQPQAVVRYKGVAVGKVSAIGFDPQTSGNVLIRIAIRQDAPITEATYASLGYQGVTGLAHVLLDDSPQPSEPLARGPSGLPRLPMRPSPFSRLTEQGPAILAQVEETTRRLNQLLGSDNQKAISAALAQIGSAAGSMAALGQRLDSTVAERLDPALAAIPPLAHDASKALQTLQQAGSHIAGIASDVGQTTKRLSAEGGAIDQIANGTQSLARAADTFASATLPRINSATEATTRTVRQLGRTVGGIGDNPQALLYGAGQVEPGPGEPGFKIPAVQP